MKKHILITMLVFLVAGCASSGPEIVDNGQPGQIKVIVFLDTNRSGSLDSGEAPLQEQVGLSQDVSCPAQNIDFVTLKISDEKGELLFDGLAPGRYCISYHGELLPTTKLAFEVPLSSQQELVAYLGLTEN